jgi:hypothetical protein
MPNGGAAELNGRILKQKQTDNSAVAQIISG